MKPALPKATLIGISLLFAFTTAFSQTTIFTYGASWKYSNGAAMPANDGQGDTWIETDYDDAAWASAVSMFHVGESGGTNLGTLRQTTYFRKIVNITGVSSYTDFDINLVNDDGAVIYVNGVEVGRNNMPAGAVSFSTNASASVNGGSENNINNININSSYFTEGNNYIAVEVHQASSNGSDMRFDMELVANAPPPLSLTRGPYLQKGTQTGITVRWRTNTASNSRVELGTVFGIYNIVVDDATSTTEHIVIVTGLSSDTKYFYRIGSTTQNLQGASDNFFTTIPPPSATRKVRIAAFGDCGRNSSTYQDQNLANYQNYLTTNGIDAPDAWILMGDNAYSSGTDAEYTTNFFGIYDNTLLKNHKLYPAPGNHDYANNAANKTSRAMAYYSNFTIPQNAECGGVASTKPNFYSFDIGNIHFLSLDSWGIEVDGSYMGRDTTLAFTMLDWIKADLAANTQKWVIAYWHHPPYTKSSHNSDSETELVNIRQKFIKTLEDRGVDMIVCGHSHAYERGYLMKGFYTNWNTFNSATHALSTSSAEYINNSTCPYVYNSNPLNHGTLYVVAGSSGASGGINTDFDAYGFPFSVNDGGVLYFEVEDNRLDAKMLRRDGTIFDRFTIIKDVNLTTNYTITLGQSQNLNASWPGAYSWSTTETTRSITVTPPAPGVYNYSVTDNFGCVTDQFALSVNGTLPVLLRQYTVNLRNSKVYVNWSTLTETNSRQFTIERSSDARNFNSIGFVNGSGNSNAEKAYEYIDPTPLTGISYYRLSQVDNDGKIKYFEIKRINNNPVQNFFADVYQSAKGELSIQVYSKTSGKVKLRVVDLSGRLLYSESWKISEGSNNKTIDLKDGVYIIEIKKNNAESVTEKVVVK